MRDQRPISEAAIEALAQGRHGDPFALLGPHREGEGWVIRALLPGRRLGLSSLTGERGIAKWPRSRKS